MPSYPSASLGGDAAEGQGLGDMGAADLGGGVDPSRLATFAVQLVSAAFLLDIAF
jgi:hypothetical protein